MQKEEQDGGDGQAIQEGLPGPKTGGEGKGRLGRLKGSPTNGDGLDVKVGLVVSEIGEGGQGIKGGSYLGGDEVLPGELLSGRGCERGLKEFKHGELRLYRAPRVCGYDE